MQYLSPFLFSQAPYAEEPWLRGQLPGEAPGAEGGPREREGKGVRGPRPRAGEEGDVTDVLSEVDSLLFLRRRTLVACVRRSRTCTVSLRP